jgi:hypothetical protein
VHAKSKFGFDYALCRVRDETPVNKMSEDLAESLYLAREMLAIYEKQYKQPDADKAAILAKVISCLREIKELEEKLKFLN